MQDMIQSREKVRRSWGADSNSVVLAAFGDPSREVDAMPIMTGVGFARESGRDLLLVLSPHVHHATRAQRVIRFIGRGKWFILDDRMEKPQEVLEASDMVMVARGFYSARIAAGVQQPCLAPQTEQMRRYITHAGVDDGRSVRFVPMNHVGSIARALCLMYDQINMPQRKRASASAASGDTAYT